MAHPHSTTPCSLTDERVLGALRITDVSDQFGFGAVEVCCPCGSWVVEDETGAAIARPEFAGAA